MLLTTYMKLNGWYFIILVIVINGLNLKRMIDNLPDILVSTDWNHFRQKLVEESHGQVHPHHSYHPVVWTV